MPNVATPLPCRRSDLVACPFGENGCYLVRNRLNGESFQIGAVEHFLLTRLDGTGTAEDLRDTFAEHFGERLTEEELEDFLHLAKERGFLQMSPANAPAGVGRGSPDPAPGGQLAKLLDPVDLSSFLSTYWERSSLFVPGGPSKVADLFNRSRFLETVTRMVNQAAARNGRDWVALNARYQDADGNHHQLAIQPAQIPALLGAGLTIQAERIDTVDPTLRDLALSLKEQIRIPGGVDVAAFLSPPGSGAALHYDGLSQWVLQIAGTKRWWYSPRPAIPFPVARLVPTSQEMEQGVDGLYRAEDMHEQLLSPGDILYLPAGAWHRVRAEEESLHLGLTVRHVDYLQLVSEILSPKLLARADWRHLPMPPAAPGDLEEMDSGLAELFAERLHELRTAVAALTPVDLFRAWRDRALDI
jgi:ribosomal protein L16 Arg81 hydroxylase